MYCRYCGKELTNDSNFCPNCGKRQKDVNSSSITKLEGFLKEHKKLSYVYFVWFLLHLLLFLSSTKDNSDGFYPWNKSINYLMEDGPYYQFSLLDECNVYDFSEFFFYTILFPIIIYGIIRLYSILLPSLKKLKNHYRCWQEKKLKKREVSQGNIAALNTPQKEESIIEPVLDKPAIEEVVSSEHQYFDNTNVKNFLSNTEIEAQLQKKHTQEKLVPTETEVEVKKMPLFKRFLGSILDKVFILQAFVFGYIIISPYGSSGNLGTYIGIRDIPPANYEWVDIAAINNYGTYNEGVSEWYQRNAQLANGRPHIGSTMELDMKITFTFIILNLVYYILFELLLSASLGKRIMEGVLLNNDNDIIDYKKVFVRGICGGIMMVGVYCVFHLLMGFTNHVVFYLFFFLMDIPVFFTKRSLLDLCTGTKYVKKTNTIQK